MCLQANCIIAEVQVGLHVNESSCSQEGWGDRCGQEFLFKGNITTQLQFCWLEKCGGNYLSPKVDVKPCTQVGPHYRHLSMCTSLVHSDEHQSLCRVLGQSDCLCVRRTGKRPGPCSVLGPSLVAGATGEIQQEIRPHRRAGHNPGDVCLKTF